MKSPKDWPAATVEMRAIAGLVPYARNSRTHSPEQVEQIAASMREWGWTNPVLVDETGTIIAGHGRILAAQKLGLTEAPVMTARGWTEAQRRAYVLADNKLALNAGWDMKTLALEISDLSGMGLDLTLTGFSAPELAALSAGPAEDDPVDAHWRGMPEFDQEDKTAFRSIPVHFKDQQAVDDFAKLIGQKITDRTRFVWFPEIEIETYADKRYASDAA